MDHPDRYPVVVTGRLDEPSRWLWLVKWFLAIPHLVILVFLWIAFVLATICAFFSVAFTGRYPRSLWDFNVGVLRWTWRVQFYAFTLASDRYPPFTLDEVEDWPARIEVAYPEQLSRGLVWVKSWLLAIPHLLLVGLFMGGAQIGGGVVAVLALVAGVALAVRGTYPESIFDLVMGLQRWCWRVVAYVALMRDEYPPFRLDAGPDEPTRPDVLAVVDPAGGPSGTMAGGAT
jgi:hypothetical protein